MNSMTLNQDLENRPFSAERNEKTLRNFSPNSLNSILFSNNDSVKRTNHGSFIERRNLVSEEQKYR